MKIKNNINGLVITLSGRRLTEEVSKSHGDNIISKWRRILTRREL
jgi:hypothetical protein